MGAVYKCRHLKACIAPTVDSNSDVAPELQTLFEALNGS